MVSLLDRKRFVNTLGAAGLGLGLLVSTFGTPSVTAREVHSQGIDVQRFQLEEGALDLSDEELKQLLILLLQERVQEHEGTLTFQSEVDATDSDFERISGGKRGDHESMRVEAYNDFTQALADELGIDDADEIDAAIRNAMKAGVEANDGLSKEGAEEMMALITAADAPIGPTILGWGG